MLVFIEKFMLEASKNWYFNEDFKQRILKNYLKKDKTVAQQETSWGWNVTSEASSKHKQLKNISAMRLCFHIIHKLATESATDRQWTTKTGRQNVVV